MILGGLVVETDEDVDSLWKSGCDVLADDRLAVGFDRWNVDVLTGGDAGTEIVGVRPNEPHADRDGLLSPVFDDETELRARSEDRTAGQPGDETPGSEAENLASSDGQTPTVGK